MMLKTGLLIAEISSLGLIQATSQDIDWKSASQDRDWTQFDQTVTSPEGVDLYRITNGTVEWLSTPLQRHINSAKMLPAHEQFVYLVDESSEIPLEARTQITDNQGFYSRENVKMVQEVFREQDWAYLFPFAPKGYTWELFLQVVARFPAFCGEFEPVRPNLQTPEDACRRELASLFTHIIAESGDQQSLTSGFSNLGDLKAICKDNLSVCDSNSSFPISSKERQILFREGVGPLRIRDAGLYSDFYDAYYNNTRDGFLQTMGNHSAYSESLEEARDFDKVEASDKSQNDYQEIGDASAQSSRQEYQRASETKFQNQQEYHKASEIDFQYQKTTSTNAVPQNLAEIPVQGLTSALWLYMTPQLISIRTPSLDELFLEEIEKEFGSAYKDGFLRRVAGSNKTYTALHASAHEFASGMLTDSELNSFGANLLLFDQTLNQEYQEDQFCPYEWCEKCQTDDQKSQVGLTTRQGIYTDLLDYFELKKEKDADCFDVSVTDHRSVTQSFFSSNWVRAIEKYNDYGCLPQTKELWRDDLGRFLTPMYLNRELCQYDGCIDYSVNVQNFTTDYTIYQDRGFQNCMCSYFNDTQGQGFDYKECLKAGNDIDSDPCQWYFPPEVSPTSVTYEFVQNVRNLSQSTKPQRNDSPSCRTWNGTSSKASTFDFTRGIIDETQAEVRKADIFILDLIKDNRNRTRTDPDFQADYDIGKDSVLAKSFPQDMFIASILGQNSVVLVQKHPEKGDEEIFIDFNDLGLSQADLAYGLWEFALRPCVDRRSERINKLDCQLGGASTVILNILDPCSLEKVDYNEFPKCDPCAAEVIDLALYPQCDPCAAETVDYLLSPQCDPCAAEIVDLALYPQCDPCAVESVDLTLYPQCDPCTDENVDLTLYPQCDPCKASEVDYASNPQCDPCQKEQVDFDEYPLCRSNIVASEKNEAPVFVDFESVSSQTIRVKQGLTAFVDEVTPIQLPEVYDKNEKDVVKILLKLNSAQQDWISFNEAKKTIYLSPTNSTTPAINRLRITLSDGKLKTEYTFDVEVEETDPGSNSDQPTESDDEETDGQNEKVDQETDPETIDDQDSGDETISDEKLLEEDIKNLVKEAESNFDPATLWALTEELPFLQGFKAIDEDFTDDEQNDQSQEYEALKAEIAAVSSDGELQIRFTQPTYIVELFDKFGFKKKAPEKTILDNYSEPSDYRMLQAYSTVNLSNLMIIYLVRGSLKSATYSQLKFTTTVIDYDDTSFTVKMGFISPPSVSLGQTLDRIVVKFLKPELFVSKVTQKPLTTEGLSVKIVSEIPRQFSNQDERDQVQATSDSIRFAANAALFGNFFLSVFLTLSLKAMWSLNHMIQVQVFLLYVIKWPANCEIMIKALNDATSLKVFTDPIFDWIGPIDFGIFDQEEDKSDENGEVYDNGVSKNLLKSLAVFGIVILILLFLLAVYCISKQLHSRGLCKVIAFKLRQKLLFNAWIRWIIESNLELTYTTIISMQLYGSFATIEDSLLTCFYILTLAVLAIWIFFSAYFLLFNRAQLNQNQFKAKFVSMYLGVQTDMAKRFLYIPVFCLRRFVLVACLVTLKDNPDQLLQVYLVVYSAYYCYMCQASPQETNVHNRLEQANEIGFILLHYLMFFFIHGDLVDPYFQWEAGKVALVLIILMFLFNFLWLVYLVVSQLIRKWKLKKAQSKNSLAAAREQRKLRKLKTMNSHTEQNLDDARFQSRSEVDDNILLMKNIIKMVQLQTERKGIINGDSDTFQSVQIEEENAPIDQARQVTNVYDEILLIGELITEENRLEEPSTRQLGYILEIESIEQSD